MPKIINSKEKVSPSDSENSCKLNYSADDGMQTSSTSFNLNDNLENEVFKTNMEEDFEKEDMETELEENIDATDQEDVTVCQSTSLAQTSTCFSNRSDLSNSKVLESNRIECKYTEQCDLLEAPENVPTENIVLNTTPQETSNEVGISLSGLSEVDDIEMTSKEEQEMLINRETFFQNQNKTYSYPSCGSSESNMKHLEQHDVEDLKNQNNDIENPKNCEEATSDAILIKKYGIKECSVHIKRAEPFAVHYSRENRTYSHPSCGASESNMKQDDVEDLENQNNDIENPKKCEEATSDAILKEKYGIKECFVYVERVKPFAVHYSRGFLKSIARDAYRSFQKPKLINFERLYRNKISQFSSLTKEEFVLEIKQYIRKFRAQEKFKNQRLAIIQKEVAKQALIQKEVAKQFS